MKLKDFPFSKIWKDPFVRFRKQLEHCLNIQWYFKYTLGVNKYDMIANRYDEGSLRGNSNAAQAECHVDIYSQTFTVALKTKFKH